MRTFLMIALLTASTATLAAGPQTEDLQSVIKAQQEQIDFLLKQLDETREVVLELKEQVEANAEVASEANEKAEILADSMEGQPAYSDTSKQFAGYDRSGTSTFGGYGELHVNMLENQATGEDFNELDFHRFVLYFAHDFNERTRFMSELEIEHALSGDGKPGEVELEQAYVEYDWAQNQSLRAGVFLIPVGILNETHEPPTFYGVERNPVEKNIIPTTWWEGGLQFHGGFADAWRYDAAIHSGLFTTADDAEHLSGSDFQRDPVEGLEVLAFGLELDTEVLYDQAGPRLPALLLFGLGPRLLTGHRSDPELGALA